MRRKDMTGSWRRGVALRSFAGVGVFAIVVAIGAAVYFFGGFFTVSAAAGDPRLVHWALVQVRTASVARHAGDASPTNLGDSTEIQVGARRYAEHGCVECHGAPGAQWVKFSEGLHPPPPDLKEVGQALTPAELFWVIQNGINMTGMPSYSETGVSDDEIWSMVAFVKALPNVQDADYAAWTAPPPTP
jgi:mono/diheme cytochrome c family protein